MATGDSADLLDRVKRVIPHRWFSWVAPYRDAVIGGIADTAAWAYSLIAYARLQTRLATATDVWLDLYAYDFLRRHLTRGGRTDTVFRALIRATILQERVTRAGMVNAITTLTGIPPWIFEPWNTLDTGAYNGPRRKGGRLAYGHAGGWGNMNLPAQVFMRVTRTLPSGIPRVGGWGSNVGGYGVGALEYIGPLIEPIGVTDDDIRQIILTTKPTGVIVWLQIN